MSSHTVDLATKQVVPAILVEAFASFRPAVSKVLQQYGFFASRESAITLHAPTASQALEPLLCEMKAALPPPLRESEGVFLQQALEQLSRLGGNVSPTSSLPAALGYATHVQTRHVTSTPPQDHRWVKWHPQKERHPTNMRDMEMQWSSEWRDRLLALLQPYFQVLPAFAAAQDRQNPQRELHDMFGTLRWSTLRQHHRNLQQMLLVCPELLPLTQDKTHSVLQLVEDQKGPPSKVKTWTTIRWLHTITGGEVVMSLVLRKSDAIRERMASTKAPEPRRATPLSIAAVCALEKAWRLRLGQASWPQGASGSS
eukprot:2925703-Amphidinium_carterae.1